MKSITITLKKSVLFAKIAAATYKRKGDEQHVGPYSLDNNVDDVLIDDYCNRRDAVIRKRIAFCLAAPTTETLTFSNDDESEEAFVYDINLDDDVVADDVKTIGRLIETYILRGATFDWYLNQNLVPSDTEKSIKDLEDEAVSVLRGKAWGTRPLQPFGPALYGKQPLF